MSKLSVNLQENNMSRESINQAVTEILGDKLFGETQKAQFETYLDQLKKDGKTGLSGQDLHVQALRNSFGTGVFNLNVESQVVERAKVLEGAKRKKDGEVPALPGTEEPEVKKEIVPPSLGLFNNAGPAKGTDAGKGEKAVSVTEGELGEALKAERAAFDRDGGQVKGGGTGTGPALSDVAAATNSGSNRSAGPGAGNMPR
jgi:hypothetical protein